MPVPSPSRRLLEVRDLSVSYESVTPAVVSGLSFDIDSGEIVGMQGRSGCGKTSSALAILRLLPAEARLSGSLRFEGRDLLGLPDRELQRIRGKQISIIHQEPTLALNPVMRVGDQVSEIARAHGLPDRRAEAAATLHRVGLEPKRYYDAYCHELSGGERHRVVLAQALICRPQLVIADEPTSSLDPRLKDDLLALIDDLRCEFGTAFLVISHDRSVVSKIADRIVDLSAPIGGPCRCTSLAVTVSEQDAAGTRGPSQDVLLSVRNLSKRYRTRGLFALGRSEKQALDGVNLTISRGKLTALVGHSGSGKSTLARCLALLEEADAGEILFDGKNLLKSTVSEARKWRPMLQYVAQDPAAALNPRLTAAEVIEEPMLIHAIGNRKQRRQTAEELMFRVGLDPAASRRSCHEFSGGQKHRLAIARALALQPKLLIFDESLSSLDAETQAEILAMLSKMKQAFGVTQLLISHDPELVKSVADRILVMCNGRIADKSEDRPAYHPGRLWAEGMVEPAQKRELVTAELE